MTLESLNEEIYNAKFRDIPAKGYWNQPGWFGSNAGIIFVGQNPGVPHKDEPFEHNRNQKVYLDCVKKSPTGKLISECISGADLSWDDVAYTNIVKSPTRDNRQPRADEINFYLPYTIAQLKLIKPKKVVLFGKLAQESIHSLIPELNETKFLHIYHPSYVLRIGNVVEYKDKIINFLKQGA